MFKIKYVLLLALGVVCGTARGQIISTIAGSGSLGYGGDGGRATAARFFDPERARVDAAGNIYVADLGNSRIRKIDAAGNITTFAGNGTAAHSGDGGAAAGAGISFPYSVAIDHAGNVYIAENFSFSGEGTDGGAWVRKVNTAGVISTIAGNGTSGYSGDGGPAINAGFRHLSDIAVDATGNVYVVDNLDNRVRKIDAAGIITTFAGDGTANYKGDSSQATAAELNAPFGIATDAAGNVYIADALNSAIRVVNSAGIITTMAGNGTQGNSGDGGQATGARLYEPVGVAVDGTGNLYIADAVNATIRKVNSSGIISIIAGSSRGNGYGGDGGFATNALLGAPYGVAVDNAGNIYIADIGNQDIRYMAGTYNGVHNINTTTAGHKLQIWPQPNDGLFTLYVPASSSSMAHVVISNAAGNIVSEFDTATNKEVATKLHTPGMYFIVAITNDGTQVAKVVVQ